MPIEQFTSTLDRLNAAWNAGDAAAYAAQFTEDATYVAYNGSILHGRDQIEATHRYLFDGPLKYSRLGDETPSASDPESVRFVRAEVAVVLIRGGVREEGQDAVTAERASVISLVLVADEKRWLIAGFQNTRQELGS